MKQVIVEAFGGVEQLKIQELPTPEPGPGQVRVRITSIGMNHAELMGRRGEYKLSTGEPPFVPGLEAGGVIDAVGEGVDGSRVGQRVALGPDVPRSKDGPQGGTYRSHMVVDADIALPAPDAIPDDQLGALWLPYLTAWGCLIWKQNIQPGQFVGIPAASSSVGLAAAQIVKDAGAIAIGLTSTPGKVDAIQALDTARFDHLIVTHEPDGSMRKWNRDLREITDGHGVDVFFDPVASGQYLNTEIRSLAMGGTIWVYGLLGEPDAVDVTPLIARMASIRGWVLTGGFDDAAARRKACRAIFDRFADGRFKQHVAGTWQLNDVRTAHKEMEKGNHIGKLVLVP